MATVVALYAYLLKSQFGNHLVDLAFEQGGFGIDVGRSDGRLRA